MGKLLPGLCPWISHDRSTTHVGWFLAPPRSVKSKSKSSIVTLETSALPRKKFPLVLEGPWKKWCFFEYKRLIEIKQLNWIKLVEFNLKAKLDFLSFYCQLNPPFIHRPTSFQCAHVFLKSRVEGKKNKTIGPRMQSSPRRLLHLWRRMAKKSSTDSFAKSTDSLATVNLYWWVDSEMKTYDFGPLFEGKLLGRGGGHFQETFEEHDET